MSFTHLDAWHDAQVYSSLYTMQATGVTRLIGALQDADTLGPQVSPQNHFYKGYRKTVRGMLLLPEVSCNAYLFLTHLFNSAEWRANWLPGMGTPAQWALVAWRDAGPLPFASHPLPASWCSYR